MSIHDEKLLSRRQVVGGIGVGLATIATGSTIPAFAQSTFGKLHRAADSKSDHQISEAAFQRAASAVARSRQQDGASSRSWREQL